MNRTLVTIAVLATLAACCTALQIPEAKQDYSLTDLEIDDPSDSRFLFGFSNTTSVTIGYNTFALGIAATLALLALLALGALYAAGDGDTSYGYSGYADYSSGYARKSYVLSKVLVVSLVVVRFLHPRHPRIWIHIAFLKVEVRSIHFSL